MSLKLRPILRLVRQSLNISILLLQATYKQFGLNFLQSFSHLKMFISEYMKFRKDGVNPNFHCSATLFYPCLVDKTRTTPLDPTYFYQDTWAAQKIFQIHPSHHFDIGSSAKTIGILSQFVPVTMIDIRPVDLKLNNLSFKEGSILNLPFEDNSLMSLSSLCVVEHIGLARYGDLLDPWGSEKAIKELIRVLAEGGDLFVSLPVDSINRVYFNAHRAFTRQYVLDLFSSLKLIEDKYIYGKQLTDTYAPDRGFGTGLFHFKK